MNPSRQAERLLSLGPSTVKGRVVEVETRKIFHPSTAEAPCSGRSAWWSLQNIPAKGESQAPKRLTIRPPEPLW